jgi:hypothetical protein
VGLVLGLGLARPVVSVGVGLVLARLVVPVGVGSVQDLVRGGVAQRAGPELVFYQPARVEARSKAESPS